MCGIAGFFGRDSAGSGERVRQMLRAQRHRGPDGAGVAEWPAPGAAWRVHFGPSPDHLPAGGAARCALGHNWLAVQDRSDAARQPVHDVSTSTALVFNGEVYNFVELRAELEALGLQFLTQSDTEVLWALWRREGVRCLPLLRGMFAFAAFELGEQALWLVRDPLGIKPLYYASTSDGLYFASEVRALHEAGVVRRELRDTAAVASAAAGINKFGERDTLYQGVYELPAGHWLRAPADAPPKVERYYDLPDPAGDLRGDEAASGLRAAVAQSVAVHLRASRRIASCVSGGLDSTNLACFIGAAARQTGHTYDTFTLRTESPGAISGPTEWESAAAVAQASGLRHHVVDRPDPVRPADVLEMVVANEVPNHVIGPVNQFLLLREIAAAGVTVVLDGQGGDELLSGYPWYAPVLLDAIGRRCGERVAAGVRGLLAGRLPLPPETASQFDRMFHNAKAWVEAFMWQGDFLGWSRGQVLELPETRYYLDGGGEWRAFRRREYLRAELPYLLRQEDRLGMWFGLECRVPFVDRPLIDFASRLAPDWLINDGYLKFPFRVMAPELPDSVRWDTRKRGFWEIDRSDFAWVAAAGKRLAFASDKLNRLFPKLREGWDALSFDQQWRLLQLAVLERATTRTHAAELCAEAVR